MACVPRGDRWCGLEGAPHGHRTWQVPSPCGTLQGTRPGPPSCEHSPSLVASASLSCSGSSLHTPTPPALEGGVPEGACGPPTQKAARSDGFSGEPAAPRNLCLRPGEAVPARGLPAAHSPAALLGLCRPVLGVNPGPLPLPTSLGRFGPDLGASEWTHLVTSVDTCPCLPALQLPWWEAVLGTGSLGWEALCASNPDCPQGRGFALPTAVPQPQPPSASPGLPAQLSP